MPQKVRLAALWERPSLRATELKLDFRQHQTEDWLVFPYEIHGLTFQEIQEHKPYLAPLINRTPSGEG
ncbi:MAG: hypothetical protein CSB49_08950 [Proteobacteria bacterium]|nr:MAG: hypothetical protein CSB49_08950 [Pseudomonadota bacterium]